MWGRGISTRISFSPYWTLGSDGWRVEVNHGARILRRQAVDTKAEAISLAKQIMVELPGTQFVRADLGEVYAWRESDQWFYSREARDGTTKTNGVQMTRFTNGSWLA